MYFSRSFLVRSVFIVVSVFSLSVQLCYLNVTNNGFGINEALLSVNAVDAFGDTVKMYYRSCLHIILIVVVLVPSLSILVRRHIISFDFRLSFFVLPLLGIVTWGVWWSGGRHLLYPVPFRVPTVLLWTVLGQYNGPRDNIYIEKPGNSGQLNIILIVDESITGKYLSINGYHRKTTPYLESIKNDLCNLGIASSSGSDSYTSNIILFSGVRSDLIDEDNFGYLKNPSIVQYAHAAGYKSFFFDGQDYKSISRHEQQVFKNDIFTYLKIDKEKNFTDQRIVDQVVATLRANKDQQVFIYSTKYGAHFPYELHYPEDETYFKPTAPGYWTDNLVENENSYCNAVRWSCDSFFETLKNKLDEFPHDTVIVYTSDHGQVIPGSIAGERVTHGKERLPDIVANVPMIVFGFGEGRQVVDKLRMNASALNNSSHFNIFPTLLTLMGYDIEKIKEMYGESLFDSINQEKNRVYLSNSIMKGSRVKVKIFGQSSSQLYPDTKKISKIPKKNYEPHDDG